MNTEWQRDAINDLVAWEKTKKSARESSQTVGNYVNRKYFKHNYINNEQFSISAAEGQRD